jgi:hypothetical protein
MGANPEFPGVDWIGPAAAGHGNYPKRFLVFHCTDNASSTAVGEADFALHRSDGIGTHYTADEGRIIQTLETFRAVGHVGSTVGNQHGIALEMCGTEASSTAHYNAVVDRAMPALRLACNKWGIPARWLTSAQANDGVSKGWLTHDDCRTVLRWYDAHRPRSELLPAARDRRVQPAVRAVPAAVRPHLGGRRDLSGDRRPGRLD